MMLSEIERQMREKYPHAFAKETTVVKSTKRQKKAMADLKKLAEATGDPGTTVLAAGPIRPATKTVGVEVPIDLHDRIAAMKKEHGLKSLSQAILLAVERGLDSF